MQLANGLKAHVPSEPSEPKVKTKPKVKATRKPQVVRRRLITRYVELIDAIEALQNAIADAPESAFTDAERCEVMLGLSKAWDGAVNSRPKFA